ncbi:hypothetical protein SDC9_154594 [bioreactor metagenome]|uniref:Uncharacterized protein n=1 Tax=bioreactor metagenome TaxID=1076179 RepID=A0A645EZ36_9ZZZZ
MSQPLGQLHAHLILREHDLVRPDFLQYLSVNVALRLADNLLQSQFLEIEGDKGAVTHVVPHGHDGAVVIAYAQRPQDRRVAGISGGGVGNLLCCRLHIFLPAVDCQHLVAQLKQLGGNGPAKPTKSNDNKGLHTDTSYPIIISNCGRLMTQPLSRLVRKAMEKDSIPTLPKYIRQIRSNLEGEASPGVSPVLSPTVPIAEATSNAAPR